MNFVPKDRIRVSEMTEVPSISDSAILLVIQDNAAHKISFSRLKEALLKDIKQQILSISADITKLALDIDKTENVDQTETIINEILEKNNELNEKIATIEKSIDKKKGSKLSEFSKKIETLNNQTHQQFNQLSSHIDFQCKNLNLLSSLYIANSLRTSEIIDTLSNNVEEQMSVFNNQLSNVSFSISKNIDKIEDTFKQVSASAKQIQKENNILSSRLDNLDVSLFGLTIADVDLDTAEVTKDKIEDGVIDVLSAQIRSLNSEINRIKQM